MQFPTSSKCNNNISANDNIPIHGWGGVVSGVSSRKGHVAEEGIGEGAVENWGAPR